MKRRKWTDLTVALSGIARVPDPRVIPFLKAAYGNKEPFTRQRAVTLLGMQRGPDAVDALVSALRDRSSDVRIAAIQALGTMGSARAIPSLKGLATRSARLRYQTDCIQEALEKIRDRDAGER